MKKSIFCVLSICIISLQSCTDKVSGVAASKQKTITTNTKSNKGLREYSTFPIGGAINISNIMEDKKLKKITSQEFSSITATNDMKMYSIASSQGSYNWTKVDALVAFTEQNNQRLFGHALVWHHGLPGWIKKRALKDNPWFKKFYKEYIQTVVGRYKGKVAAWDVVNEALATEGKDGMRKTFFLEQLGPDYIADAFRFAHEADPDALLFYNDFNLERDTIKVNNAIALIEKLKTEGVPIHGIGLQTHLRMDIPDALIADAFKKFAATGLQVHLSEVDIIFNKHNDTQNGGVQIFNELTEEMKTAQAEKYRSLAKLYKENIPAAQQFGITFWDFTDRDTWINGFFNLNDWPTIYDKNLEPKPAYEGFRQGLLSK